MVIYEDNHLLVINKMPGELVQGDRTNDLTLLDRYKDYIKRKYDKPGAVFLHPTHRLDRPVSGCVILARTSKALSRMTIAFKNGEVLKTYHAITTDKGGSGRYHKSEGRLDHYIIKDPHKNFSKIARQGQKNAKRIALRYKLIASIGSNFLYQINPLTGRSHQIRVQLQEIGCPIIGDIKYGGKLTSDNRLIYLHCTSMEFTHPTKKESMTVFSLPIIGQLWEEYKPFLIEIHKTII